MLDETRTNNDSIITHDENFYEILNVPVNASKTEVRESYIRLRGIYGGKNQVLYSLISEEESQQMLAKVEAAFRTLNDDIKRNSYDKEMGLNQESRQNYEQSADIDPFNSTWAPPIAEKVPEDRLQFIRPEEPFHSNPAMTQEIAEFNVQGGRARPRVAIKNTKASKASEPEVQELMRAILEEGEPGEGEVFKLLRETAEVSEEEMQDRTKICIEYIRAIEGNAFERLPKAVFVKGFLKSYLKYLHISDTKKHVETFAHRLEDWQKTQQGN